MTAQDQRIAGALVFASTSLKASVLGAPMLIASSPGDIVLPADFRH